MKSDPLQVVLVARGEMPRVPLWHIRKGCYNVNVGDIIQSVGTLGFPVVMALLAAWYIKYLGDKHSETISNMQAQLIELSDRQNEQLDKMTDAIAEMNRSITVLNTALSKGLSND